MKAIAAAVLVMGVAACGAQETAAKKPAEMTRAQRADLMMNAPVHTFYLKHSSQPNDGNEILTDLRLMLDPSIKMYLVPSQNVIMMRALPEDLALATQIIGELDRDRALLRLTYLLTEFDGTRKLATQRYTMTMADGQRATMKQGERVSVQTGRYEPGNANPVGTILSYTDIGLSFDATLTAKDGEASLTSKVEESALAEDKAVTTGTNPVIRQTTLNAVSTVSYGKPQMLGSLDVPGGTHRMQVEAVVDKLN